MNRFHISTLSFLLAAAAGSASVQAEDQKLTGTPIGTSRGWQYDGRGVCYDIQHLAFDGSLDTYFATDERSYTWVGLDLSVPHVITRVGWSPRRDPQGPRRVRTGVIQGANSPDFLDAVPLWVIRDDGRIGEMTYADTDCSRGFRYVRYVSTSDSRCNIAELEFYGHEGEGDDSHLYQVTSLPTVVINTAGAEEPYDKEHDIDCNVIIIDNHTIDTDRTATVRERGNGSREFPKKPWRVKFDKKVQPLDAPAKAKKWTLINNYGDKTLMRNLVAFEIARRLDMSYVAYARPVDVILNGEFKGCYQLCDQMEVNPGRVDITEMDETDNEGEALTGGYFFEIDAYAYLEPEGSWFESLRGIPVTIKSPDDGGTPVQRAYLSGYFQELEDRVYDGTYREILDIESFIRHFITGELAGNTDTYWSTYMYKDRNDPMIYTGPVWDNDLGFDNDYRTYPIDQFDGFLFDSGHASSAHGMKELVRRIVTYDRATRSDISRIWSVARNGRDLTAGGLAEYIDSLAAVMDESQQLNFRRWPILDQKVHANPRALGSYGAEVQAVKDYLMCRFDKLDRLMSYDPQLGAVGDVAADATAEIRVAGRQICASDETAELTVRNPAGALVCVSRGMTRPLAPGLYLVTAAGLTAKVIIK